MAWRLAVPCLLAFAVPLILPDGAAGQGSVDVVLTAPTITFTQPGFTDFDTGWIEHGGVDVTVASRPANRPWVLWIRATSGTMGQGKPVSDLEWRTAGSTVWRPLSQTGEAVLQGTGDQNITLFFRVLLSWTEDGPGTYSTGLELTALRI